MPTFQTQPATQKLTESPDDNDNNNYNNNKIGTSALSTYASMWFWDDSLIGRWCQLWLVENVYRTLQSSPRQRSANFAEQSWVSVWSSLISHHFHKGWRIGCPARGSVTRIIFKCGIYEEKTVWLHQRCRCQSAQCSYLLAGWSVGYTAKHYWDSRRCTLLHKCMIAHKEFIPLWRVLFFVLLGVIHTLLTSMHWWWGEGGGLDTDDLSMKQR